eukprot:730542-Amphidinium_carterae.1
MASTGAVPAAPKPKPSTAATEVVSSNLPPATEEVSSPEYSPAVTPEEPQVVESSDSESLCIPDFLKLTVTESLGHLLVSLDEVVEFSAQSLHSWWTANSEHENYAMFSPEWLKPLNHIKQHVVVNAYSKDPTEEVTGYKLCYLHSTASTLRR